MHSAVLFSSSRARCHTVFHLMLRTVRIAIISLARFSNNRTITRQVVLEQERHGSLLHLHRAVHRHRHSTSRHGGAPYTNHLHATARHSVQSRGNLIYTFQLSFRTRRGTNSRQGSRRRRRNGSRVALVVSTPRRHRRHFHERVGSTLKLRGLHGVDRVQSGRRHGRRRRNHNRQPAGHDKARHARGRHYGGHDNHARYRAGHAGRRVQDRSQVS